MTSLGTLANGGNSCALGKNIDDDIVGWAIDSSARTRAVIWQYSGSSWTITDLGTLGGDDAMAWDINSSDVIVGWSETDDEPAEVHAVKWTYSGGQWNITELDNFTNGNTAKAYAINDDGDIVGMGWTSTTETTQRAALWQGTTIKDIGSDDVNCFYYNPEGNEWVMREAYDINDDGVIVGWGLRTDDNHSNLTRAFALKPMWCEGDANGDIIVDVEDLIDLLAAWGETDCRPEDLNESGEVNTADLLILLADWGCPEYVNDPPQSVQDCLDEYGGNPEALLACLEAISLQGGE